MPPDIPLLRRPFYFLRHGESTANRAEIIAGSIDVPLTEDGRAQADRAAETLAGLGIRSLHASTLKRAVDTARPLAERLGLEIHRHAGLNERSWGVLEDRPLSERTGGPHQEVPGAEPWADFVARTWAALASLDGPAPLLIVAHSGTLRALREGLEIDDTSKAGNAEPLRLSPANGRWRLDRP